jgi:hypothetical protein
MVTGIVKIKHLIYTLRFDGYMRPILYFNRIKLKFFNCKCFTVEVQTKHPFRILTNYL